CAREVTTVVEYYYAMDYW
nr:immunoglobulin heavy chain junction region [Mus musculus]MBK4198502.1 immunoglobulin heavy chain junction region [Mus musculus]MBK4198503.1 immunoglobulin heavy chain junction region [Mus musculus]MBK4198504.1 immunoglobulin heavy chain junction region [Mus musculus]